MPFSGRSGGSSFESRREAPAIRPCANRQHPRIYQGLEHAGTGHAVDAEPLLCRRQRQGERWIIEKSVLDPDHEICDVATGRSHRFSLQVDVWLQQV